MSSNKLGDFLAILWECWNAGNCFIFGKPDRDLSVLAAKALAFVISHREVHALDVLQHDQVSGSWVPPTVGCLKLNFDGGKVGDDHG